MFFIFFVVLFLVIEFECFSILMFLGIGDWGLEIGDWAIPNPQSPIPHLSVLKYIKNYFKFVNYNLLQKIIIS